MRQINKNDQEIIKLLHKNVPIQQDGQLKLKVIQINKLYNLQNIDIKKFNKIKIQTILYNQNIKHFLELCSKQFFLDFEDNESKVTLKDSCIIVNTCNEYDNVIFVISAVSINNLEVVKDNLLLGWCCINLQNNSQNLDLSKVPLSALQVTDYQSIEKNQEKIDVCIFDIQEQTHDKINYYLVQKINNQQKENYIKSQYENQNIILSINESQNIKFQIKKAIKIEVEDIKNQLRENLRLNQIYDLQYQQQFIKILIINKHQSFYKNLQIGENIQYTFENIFLDKNTYMLVQLYAQFQVKTENQKDNICKQILIAQKSFSKNQIQENFGKENMSLFDIQNEAEIDIEIVVQNQLQKQQIYQIPFKPDSVFFSQQTINKISIKGISQNINSNISLTETDQESIAIEQQKTDEKQSLKFEQEKIECVENVPNSKNTHQDLNDSRLQQKQSIDNKTQQNNEYQKSQLNLQKNQVQNNQEKGSQQSLVKQNDQKDQQRQQDIHELMKTLKKQRQTDQQIIDDLRKQIQILTQQESKNNNKMLDLNSKINELKCFKEELQNQNIFYQKEVKIDQQQQKSTDQNIYQNISQQNVRDEPQICISQEIQDINIQNFEVQVHSILQKQDQNYTLKEFQICFNDFLGAYHLSQNIVSKKQESNGQHNLYQLEYQHDPNVIINFNWQFDPFEADKREENQFKIHYNICKILQKKYLTIYLLDRNTSLRKAFCKVQLKYFFRQGKRDQIMQKVVPLYSVNMSQDQHSQSLYQQIGSISLVLINRVDKKSIQKKEQFLASCQNFNNLYIIQSNKNQNQDKGKQRIIVRKKNKNQNVDLNEYISHPLIFKEIAQNEEKRKMFRIQRFKNNFMKQVDNGIDAFGQKEKLQKLLMHTISNNQSDVICFANQKVYVPFIFLNKYNSRLFQVNIDNISNLQNQNLFILNDKEQVKKQKINLEEYLYNLPEEFTLPKTQDFFKNQFELKYNDQSLLFFEFYTQQVYKKNQFIICFLDENQNTVFQQKLNFISLPSYCDQILNFYQPEKQACQLQIDISDVNNLINKTDEQDKNLFIQCSLEQVSFHVQNLKLILKLATLQSPNILDFNIFFYDNKIDMNLLKNINVRIYCMRQIEIIPEAGIDKNFELLIPSMDDRQVQIYSSHQQITKFAENTVNLTQTNFNRICGSLKVLEENEQKIIITLKDQHTQKQFSMIMLYVLPKTIKPFRVLREKLLKDKQQIISFNYFNKKSILATYLIQSSKENLLMPMQKKIKIESFKELEVKFTVKPNQNIQNQTINIFFTEENQTINDCIKLELEFYDRYQLIQQNTIKRLFVLKLYSENFKFKFKFKQQSMKNSLYIEDIKKSFVTHYNEIKQFIQNGVLDEEVKIKILLLNFVEKSMEDMKSRKQIIYKLIQQKKKLQKIQETQEQELIDSKNLKKEGSNHYQYVLKTLDILKAEESIVKEQFFTVEDRCQQLQLDLNERNMGIQLHKEQQFQSIHPEQQKLNAQVLKLQTNQTKLRPQIYKQNNLNKKFQSDLDQLRQNNEKNEQKKSMNHENFLKIKDKPYRLQINLSHYEENFNICKDKVQRAKLEVKEFNKRFINLKQRLENLQKYMQREQGFLKKFQINNKKITNQILKSQKQLKLYQIDQATLIDEKRMSKSDLSLLYKQIRDLSFVNKEIKKIIKDKQMEYKLAEQNKNKTIEETKQAEFSIILKQKERARTLSQIQNLEQKLLDIYDYEKTGVVRYDYDNNQNQNLKTSILKNQEKIQNLKQKEQQLLSKETKLIQDLKQEVTLCDNICRQVKQTDIDYSNIQQELAIKVLIIQDEKKKKNDLCNKLTKFKQMYQEVKQERNQYVSLIQVSSLERSEIKEQFKTFQQQLALLKTNFKEKEQILANFTSKNLKMSFKQEKLHNDFKKIQRNLQNCENKNYEMCNILKSQSNILKKLDNEMIEIGQNIQTFTTQRNNFSSQIIKVNKNLVFFIEKINISRNMLAQSRQGLLFLQHFLQIIVYKRDCAYTFHKKTLNKINIIPEISEKVIKFKEEKQQLLKTKKQLQQKIENIDQKKKMRVVGSEIKDEKLIDAKLKFVQQQLNEKNEQCLKQQLVVDEIKKSCENLQQIIQVPRKDVLSYMELSKNLESKCKQVSRKLMSLVCELSLYQAKRIQLEKNKDQLEQQLEQITSRVQIELPPQNESEVLFLKQMHSQMLQKKYLNNKKLRMSQNIELPLIKKTTAFKRKDTYFDKIGFPKPYGKFQPFYSEKLPLIRQLIN